MTDKLNLVKVKKKERERVFHNSNVMNYLVITCILSIIVYTVVNLYFYYRQGTPPPDLLTQLFFAFFGGELLAMASITISKHRVRAKEEEEEC